MRNRSLMWSREARRARLMCRMMHKMVNRPGTGMDGDVVVMGGGMITSSGL